MRAKPQWLPRFLLRAALNRRLPFILWFLALPLLRIEPLAQSASTRESARSIVAVFRLSGPVTETPTEDAWLPWSLPGTSLKDLVTRLKKAAEDPVVKAVVVLPESASLEMAQVEELRLALSWVRRQGKEVFVHADSLSLPDYLLACGASRISVVPTGLVLVPGLRASTLYLRGLLDKIGVQPDFLTEGAYKSAAEMFLREGPSAEADQMMNWLLDSWHATLIARIAKGRKVEADKVKRWLDEGLFTAERAKTAGLIDAAEHYQEFEARLKERYGREVAFEKRYGRKSAPAWDFTSPLAIFKLWADLVSGMPKKTGAKPAVGIVYVEGSIMTGQGAPSPLGGVGGAFSSVVRRVLEKAAEDDSIRAVVLRIDSPGGSATASEIILEATKRLKAKKPFVVSMGSVAGSGGYYVACGADTIFADATTLTGSIGVLAGKLVTTGMWKQMGITFQEYKRGRNAGLLSTDERFSESERTQMRAYMNQVYTVFKDHVKAIRGNRLKQPIEDLAGGRVFTGQQALELGLVDRLGTMSEAIAYVANQANLQDYDVRTLPDPKSFIEQFMEDLTGGDNNPGHLPMAAGNETWLKLAIPYVQNLDPERGAALVSALRRLQIMQQEGVVLAMPEILTR